MFKSKKTIYIILSIVLFILVTSIFIYYIYSKDEINSIDIYLNKDIETPYRRKLNNKHTKSKSIYISPRHDISTKKMVELLRNQLIHTDITDKTDNKYQLQDYPYIVKLFYSNNCPHCVVFKPLWNMLKEKHGNRLKFIDVDCTYNPVNLPYVQGVPTIAIYDSRDRYISNYSKQRTKEALNEFFSSLK